MEYEYSFNVTDIVEYLKYCEENNYKLLSKTKQVRTIYRNNNGTMARITVEQGDKTTNKLDFKEDKLTNNVLSIRKESKSIEFDNVEDCEDILNFLNYHKDNTLIRERYTYQKDKVLFEIDIYIEPKALVVSLEGDKFEVDKAYKSLEVLNIKYKI